MNGRDPHSALRSTIVHRITKDGAEIAFVRLQFGKTDLAYSLHVNPTSYSTSGIQQTDFLAYLGFRESGQCPFTSSGRCYVRWADENFDVGGFAEAFSSGFKHIERAEGELEQCGFGLSRPEGLAYFGHGRPSRSSGMAATLEGDGHTARQVQTMKQSEDGTFEFRFTFVEGDREQKGFVTHYRPKHPPLSSELNSVFKYLGLNAFGQCPEFDFEACHYRTLPYQKRGEGFFENNTEFAHRCFDAHAAHFSNGIENLLESNAAAERVGIGFLPVPKPTARLNTDLAANLRRPSRAAPGRARATTATSTGSEMPESFDVAISFAGSEREQADRLAELMREAGFVVFYDNYYPEQLWGKDLVRFFDEIYRKRARFCVVFVSREYRDRIWTNHELRSAQARALEEKGNEYILPIKVDDAELDGLPPSIGYLPISLGVEKIAELLIRKLTS